MSKKSLLVAVVMMATGIHGRLSAQSQELTMSLEKLFRIADNHNTSIKSFESAISEAEAGIDAAKAERLPDVEASAAFSYLGGGRITDRNLTNGFGVHIPHYGNNFALTASMPVYTGGAIQTGINLSRLTAEMARTNAISNRQRVRMILVGYYLQLHNLRNQEKVFDENIHLTETLIEHTQKRQAEGVVLKNDITRYELQLENLKLGRTQILNRAKIVNHQLKTALGITEDVSILPAATFEETGNDKGTEKDWQQAAIENSPTLQRTQLGIDMSEQKVQLEKSARRPTIAIIAEEHFDGPITVEIPNLNKNLNYFFVGVGLKYRFGALYKNNRKVRQAKLAAETARLQHRTMTDNLCGTGNKPKKRRTGTSELQCHPKPLPKRLGTSDRHGGCCQPTT